MSNQNNNRIILARKSGQDKNFDREQAAVEENVNITKLALELLTIGADAKKLYQNMKSTAKHQDWSDDSPVLTD